MSDAETLVETVRDGWQEGRILVGDHSFVGFGTGMASLMETLQEAVDLDIDAIGNMRLEFTLPDREQPWLVEPARLAPYQHGWRLEFTDGSRLLLPDEVPTATRVRVGSATETETAGTVTPTQDGPFRSGATFPRGAVLQGEGPTEVVDGHAVLEEPFTGNQYASIESILGWLWDAATTDQLTESQQAQILAIAQLIKDEAIDTVPEKTKRETMVRLVQRGLKYVVREMPKDALALTKLAEILRDSGWLETLNQVIG